MAVKKGYKQTEVGVIPKDWHIVEMKSIARVIRGASPRPKGDPRYYGGNVPRLMVEDITRDKHWVTPQIDYLTDDGAKLSRLCKRGTIAVVCSGTPSAVGLPAILAVDSCIHDGILGLVNLSKEVSTEFVFHKLRSYQHDLHAAATHGGTFVNLTTFGFSAFKLVLPSNFAEQKAIAGALSDADAWVESLEQLIAKKRQIKQGAMQELLTGKRRLPGFSGKWDEAKLIDIAEGRKELFDDGDWIESEHITNQGIRLVQTGNIGIGCFMEKDDKKYIYESSFMSLGCKEIKSGDLLVCRLAEPAGRACVLPDIGETKVVTSVDVTIFRPPPQKANRVFLANVFSTSEWFREVSERTGGTTHKRIARGALGRITIRLPKVDEQLSIANCLADMDTEIKSLEEKLAKAREIKQGMMQELLTGRIRLIEN